MIQEIEPVTLKEAEFLLGRPKEQLSRAIDRGEVERRSKKVIEPAKPIKKRKRRATAVGRRRARRTSHVAYYQMPRTVTRTVRTLGTHELLYFFIGGDAPETLSRAGRRKLYDAIRSADAGTKVVKVGPFDVPIKEASATLLKRYKMLQDMRDGINEPASGDPVLKGTENSVYRIAALAEGQGLQETLEDYPSLTRKQVTRAVEYARAYPKKGRPYPARSLKRAAAALVGSGALSIDIGEPVDISIDRFRDSLPD